MSSKKKRSKGKKKNNNDTQTIRLEDTVKLPQNVVGKVKYIGKLVGRPKNEIYYGLLLRKPMGDTNGSVKKKQYFKCAKNHGIFVQRHDILHPLPIIFTRDCDRMFRILKSTIYSFFDPMTLGNFCKVGAARYVFKIDSIYDLNWKQCRKIFVGSKTNENNLRNRWSSLSKFYREHIYKPHLYEKSIGFALWNIINVKNNDIKTTEQRAIVLLKLLLPRVSSFHASVDKLGQKVKINKAKTKHIKMDRDIAFGDHIVSATIYYKYIKRFDDIFRNKESGSKPFKRNDINRKELKGLINDFLMGSYMDLIIEQWYVVNLERRAQCSANNSKNRKHSYIIGWISLDKVIVFGGGCGYHGWAQYNERMRKMSYSWHSAESW
eukprot:201988_1